MLKEQEAIAEEENYRLNKVNFKEFNIRNDKK